MKMERDRSDKQQVDFKLLWRLFTFAKPWTHLVAAAFALIILTAITSAAGPWIIKIAIDDNILKGDYDGLKVTALLFLGVLILDFLCHFAQTLCTQMLGQKVMFRLRNIIFDHLQKLSISYFDRNPVGRIVTRVTSDVENLNQLFTEGLVAIFGDIFLIAGIVAAMVMLDTTLALWTFLILPILVAVTFVFRRRIRKGFDDIRFHLARINSNLQENITGMKTVQLFLREKKNFEIFDGINRDHRAAHERTILHFALFFPIVEVLSAAALALVILKGGEAVGTGALTFGVVFAFIRYLEMFFRPVADLAEKYSILQSAVVSSERIFKLLDTKPEVLDRHDPKVLALPVESVVFDNVTFGYNPDNPVLHSVSFGVNRGEAVALVGHTGAGKSTVINLLSRFYDVQEGRVLVNGADVRDIGQRSLRSAMVTVLQDPFIFSRSVADNIRLGKDGIPDGSMIRAAQNARAHAFIENLPDGYDSKLAERGENLSTGQKQLLSFARAMAFDPDILILDEATASIDTETESLIQAATAEITRQRTSIIIAHRLSTIRNADRIIVLHHGRKEEEGTHDELLAQRGLYYRLYQMQYREELIRGKGGDTPRDDA